jgi:predicted CopG family antitoxin
MMPQSISKLQLKSEQRSDSEVADKLKSEQRSDSELADELKSEQRSDSELAAKLKSEQRSDNELRFVAFPATEYDEVFSGYQPGQMVHQKTRLAP